MTSPLPLGALLKIVTSGGGNALSFGIHPSAASNAVACRTAEQGIREFQCAGPESFSVLASVATEVLLHTDTRYVM